MSDTLVYPLGSKEATEYLDKNGIDYIVLPNGLQVLLTHKPADDRERTNLSWHLRSGAYHDPKGKTGLHHLSEHLINIPLYEEAGMHQVSINAATSACYLYETASGTSNYKEKDFGLWPMLPKIAEVFQNPLSHLEDAQSTIESEKKVVMQEIHERKEDFYHTVSKEAFRAVTRTTNPYRVEVPGDEKTLASISLMDIAQQIPLIYSPAHSLIMADVEGSLDSYKAMKELLIETASNYGSGRAQANPILDPKLFETKPLVAGERHELTIPSQHQLTYVEFFRTFSWNEFSKESLSARLISDLLQGRFFNHVRKLGLSYSPRVHIQSLSPNQLLVTFNVIISNDQYSDEMIQTLTNLCEQTLASITVEEIDRVLSMEKLADRAIKISKKGRLHDAGNDILYRGLIQDLDKRLQLYLELSREDIQKAIRSIQKKSPITLIIRKG